MALAKHLVQNVAPQSVPGELTRRIVAGLQDGSIFDVLTNVVVFTAGIFYMLSVLAVIVLRFRQPTLRRPYRTWGYPLAPLIFVAVYLWFLAQVYVSNPLESRAGLLVMALGLPVYFLYRRKGAPSASIVKGSRRCGRVRVARRPGEFYTASPHLANLCAPPAGTGRPVSGKSKTPCERRRRMFQVPLANNA